jgi:hypothetical protein
MDCREKIMSEEYRDYLVEWFIAPMDSECEQQVNSRFRVEYMKGDGNPLQDLSVFGYRAVPKLYGFMDTGNMEAAGILPLQRQPYLNLLGQEVLVGIVDTGIEYQNPLFLDEAGRCRIAAIWDQTLTDGPTPKEFAYGREFSKEEIRQALQDGVTLPTYDGLGSPDGDDADRSLYEKTAGHGTFLAGIAAGQDAGANFTGAAPAAELVVVKLKNAKQYLRRCYQVDARLPAVQENDIMLGVRYLIERARQFAKPMVILLGVGTNQGDHSGGSVLGVYLATEASSNGIIVVAPAGNEAIASHHFYGAVSGGSDFRDVEVKVSEGVTGFQMELWGRTPRGYEVQVITPGGEETPRIPATLSLSGDLGFKLIGTTVTVQYHLFVQNGLNWVVKVRLKEPVPGNWRLRVYQNNAEEEGFHVWLPITGFLTGEVVFLQADPYVTVTEPGNQNRIITAAAYRYQNDSLYAASGRGYSRDGAVKPDIAAPGVDITGPAVFTGTFPLPPVTETIYTKRSGTSVAAAHVAGACAQLLEWAVTKGNLPVMNTQIAAGFLLTGADRAAGVTYPNREWGYGTLNIYRSILEA